MRLVFPTLWSPSSTILVRFGGDDEKSAETGEVTESDMLEDSRRLLMPLRLDTGE